MYRRVVASRSRSWLVTVARGDHRGELRPGPEAAGQVVRDRLVDLPPRGGPAVTGGEADRLGRRGDLDRAVSRRAELGGARGGDRVPVPLPAVEVPCSRSLEGFAKIPYEGGFAFV